ncbi:hypothetical protein KHF85_01205 [Xanthomonas translucens pv. graminis]|uniref:hypothetical protein n=1 Tax=Xanthomonas graminis TaxID=3390026 RepID=UPI00253FA789|nr:hypothetical protein [Xanthomonas translucens]WIH05178.1 hypothetical protein KHF85_01205 [Xanthomonas translucens pv. graminis]
MNVPAEPTWSGVFRMWACAIALFYTRGGHWPMAERVAAAFAAAVAFAFDLPGLLGAADPAGEYPKGGAQDARRFSLAHG